MIHVATRDDLAKLLAQLRGSTSVSYRTLASEVDVSPGTLLQMEHARHWPRLDTVGRLLQWYGETVTIGWDPEGKEGAENDYGRGV